MKRLLIASAALFSLLASPTVSFAQDTDLEEEVVTPKKPKDLWLYVDANLATAQFSKSDGLQTATSDSTINAYLRAGLKYKYFGAEVEYGTGLSDIDEGGLSLGLGSQLAAFGILRLPSDNYDIFFRGGYHSADFDITGGFFDQGQNVTVDGTVTADGFAFGVGGTYYLADNFGVRADITGYNAKDIIDAGYVVGSLGGTVKF